MATAEETSILDQPETDGEGSIRVVSDAALSKLAPRLGKDWRAFLRGELWINQMNIEEIESEPNLPVAERIYRLLRLWKTTSGEAPTVSCLLRHLKSFGYSIDTWEVLTKDESDFENTKKLPEPQYHNAQGGANKDVVEFCHVVETTEDLNLPGFRETLNYPKETKLDVVDVTRTNVYLARDIEGNIVHMPREKCRPVQFHTPILWENCWFHEEVTRSQLKRLFSPYEKGTFMIRESSENGFFALSVKDTSDVKSFRIKCTETGYILSDKRHFYSLTDLINCYKGTWIFTTEEGRLFLRDCIPKGRTTKVQPANETTESQIID